MHGFKQSDSGGYETDYKIEQPMHINAGGATALVKTIETDAGEILLIATRK